MKKTFILFLIMIICFFLTACELDPEKGGKPGKTDNVDITIGESAKFTEVEIKSAMECVLTKFTWTDCELTYLWYDEEKSDNEAKVFSVTFNVKEENMIILLSNYNTGAHVNMTLNANSTYSNWMWILIRDSGNSNWRVDDWGY